MHAFLRKSGAIAAAALLATSCAVRPPVTTLDSPTSQTIDVKEPGNVTVPLTLPELSERSVQYAYDRNYINTVEVRLRDSLGNESVQYVVRNAYLAGSRASGTINVTFFNVMPGTFTLTVRSSHRRLLAADGPIKYDGLRDIFFVDNDADHSFDVGEDEMRIISMSASTVATSNFLVFASDSRMPAWAFPDALRTDTTSTAAGFGIGAATQSIIPNQTTQVAVTVGQVPKWDTTEPHSSREVTAGDTVTLKVASADALQPVDQIMVTSPGVTFNAGIPNFDDSRFSLYAPTVNVGAGTAVFTPTVATNPDSDTAPGSWPIWLVRGQAAAEIGLTPNAVNTNAPKIIVHPALVNRDASRAYGTTHHLSPGTTSTVRYDLRDVHGNRVAGNVAGVNNVSIGSVRRANAGVEIDFAVVSHTYNVPDPRNNLMPFILPGRTTGTVSNSGIYMQGSTAPGLITTAATYSVTGPGNVLRISQLEVPYYVYKDNAASFGAAGSNTYTLNVVADTANAGKFIATLSLTNGPLGAVNVPIASDSVDPAMKPLVLKPAGVPVGTLPLPMDMVGSPVIIQFPEGRDLRIADTGTAFQVTNYGNRRVSDTDRVRMRVLNGKNPLFTKDVDFQWLQ
ncbi:hypothetical protein D3C86_363420 [compost metagenome]